MGSWRDAQRRTDDCLKGNDKRQKKDIDILVIKGGLNTPILVSLQLPLEFYVAQCACMTCSGVFFPLTWRLPAFSLK